MNKLIAVFALAVLLIPQASFAAWAYKGVPIKPGTDAEVAAQINAIDASITAPESPSVAEQIALLVAQIDTLQAQLAKLQGLGGATIKPMPEEEEVTPEEPAIDRDALVKESEDLEASIDWRHCRSAGTCSADAKAKIERINEITSILGSGCTYEITKGHVGKSCGG